MKKSILILAVLVLSSTINFSPAMAIRQEASFDDDIAMATRCCCKDIRTGSSGCAQGNRGAHTFYVTPSAPAGGSCSALPNPPDNVSGGCTISHSRTCKDKDGACDSADFD